MARTTTRIRLAALGAAAAVALTGCAAMTPVMTQQPYAAGDGVRVAVRDDVVIVENLMILAEDEGQTGHVLGALVNRTAEPVTFSLELGSATPMTFRVDARSSTNLTEENVTIEDLEVAPGAKLVSSVSTGEDGAIEAHVPVLDGTIPPYDEFLDAVQSGESWEPRSRD